MIPFERFDAWKRAHRLALDVYDASARWPRSERYELTTQVRRACLSVPTNLAEGIAKRGPRELRRYLDIALGSLAELCYLLLFARDRGLLSVSDWARLDKERNRVGQLIWGLARAVSQDPSHSIPKRSH
jgi:four helix bundle protein